MWDSSLGSGNAKGLPFSPEMGWGQGPPPVGGLGPEPGVGEARPEPFPPATLGPGAPLPLRTAVWNHLPALLCTPPPPLLGRMAWALGPCHLRPPVWLPRPLSMEAASRQPARVLGAAEGGRRPLQGGLTVPALGGH